MFARSNTRSRRHSGEPGQALVVMVGVMLLSIAILAVIIALVLWAAFG